MLTPGENYYRLFEGKKPEYVPFFDMMPNPKYVPSAVMWGPGFIDHHGPNGGKDPWGVEYIVGEDGVQASMPKTWDFLLEDINDWERVIKNPDLSAIDWKSEVEKDTQLYKEVFKVDRDQTLLLGTVSAGFFQDLMGMMGFTEGLVALYNETDEVKRLFEYMLEYYLQLQDYMIRYYSPDAIYVLDDTATKLNTFMSAELFREALLPFYKAIIENAHDHGLPVQYHNCGHCEEIIPDMVEIGVNIWDPAQTVNDLDAIKKQFGNKLAIVGGWDWEPPVTWPVVDEGAVRQSVRDSIDRYAPGGGYAFLGAVIGSSQDAMLTGEITDWIMDEAHRYGEAFYETHPDA